MNFKNIVWFIKATSYFVLLRSLGKLDNVMSSKCDNFTFLANVCNMVNLFSSIKYAK